MDPEQDPFAFFASNPDPEISEMGKPKKKVHLDPTIQLESAIIANKFGKDKIDNLDQAGGDSDNEVNKNRLEDIDIQVERNDEGCIHEVFYPKGYERKVYSGPCNARKYKFTLDPFQQKAVRAI